MRVVNGAGLLMVEREGKKKLVLLVKGNRHTQRAPPGQPSTPGVNSSKERNQLTVKTNIRTVG